MVRIWSEWSVHGPKRGRQFQFEPVGGSVSNRTTSRSTMIFYNFGIGVVEARTPHAKRRAILQLNIFLFLNLYHWIMDLFV